MFDGVTCNGGGPGLYTGIHDSGVDVETENLKPYKDKLAQVNMEGNVTMGFLRHLQSAR